MTYQHETDYLDDGRIILLTDEEGDDLPFQLLDAIELGGVTYAVTAPLDDEDDEILIFRIVETDEGETYEMEEDDDVLQRVFDVFRSSDEDYEFCDAE